MAALSRDPDILRAVIEEANFPACVRDGSDRLPLFYVIHSGSEFMTEMLKILFTHGIGVNDTSAKIPILGQMASNLSVPKSAIEYVISIGANADFVLPNGKTIRKVAEECKNELMLSVIANAKNVAK